MASDGSVMALGEDLFHSDLLALSLAPAVAQDSLIRIDVGNGSGRTGLHVPLCELRERLEELDRASAYRIVGASSAQRALAAFILTQHGFCIGALAED